MERNEAPDLRSVLENFGTAADFLEGAGRLAGIADKDVEVATTPKELVFRQEKVSLYRYRPIEGVEVRTGPVLIVYGLIGRYTMIDLQEDRSLVRNLLLRGVDLYVVDWGHPTRADQNLTLDDYVNWYLADCVDQILDRAGREEISILGICEGGVLSTLYAAQNGERVKNLILTITPIDFHGDLRDTDGSHGFLNVWTRSLDDSDIRKLVDTFGNLPGEITASIFQMMTPVKTLTKYNRDLLAVTANEESLLNFLRMEKWLADRPDHPGAGALQWLIELYKENRLIKGTFELSGKPVCLEALTMPILNVYAEHDHIIPSPCSTRLKELAGTDDYTELALPGGHVGVYVSRKCQGILSSTLFEWLIERQK